MRVCARSLCRVASACLDQLSVWYLYGSNFSRCILVMVLCTPHTRTNWLSLSASFSPQKPTASPTTLHRAHFAFSADYRFYHTSVLTALLRTSWSEQHMHITWSSRLVREGVWNGTMLRFLVWFQLRQCLWQQCFIYPFLSVSAVSCLNMNGMIGTSLTHSQLKGITLCTIY